MKVRVQVHSAGAMQILKSQAVQNELRARGERILRAAGGAPDFELDVRVGANRARASVRTATDEGRRAEATDRALSRALDAGR